VAVTNGCGEDPREEVQILPSVRVPDRYSLALYHYDWFLVEMPDTGEDVVLLALVDLLASAGCG